MVASSSANAAAMFLNITISSALVLFYSPSSSLPPLSATSCTLPCSVYQPRSTHTANTTIREPFPLRLPLQAPAVVSFEASACRALIPLRLMLPASLVRKAVTSRKLAPASALQLPLFSRASALPALSSTTIPLLVTPPNVSLAFVFSPTRRRRMRKPVTPPSTYSMLGLGMSKMPKSAKVSSTPVKCNYTTHDNGNVGVLGGGVRLGGGLFSKVATSRSSSPSAHQLEKH